MQTIDATGQECPLPVVRANKALDKIESGTVEVLVDNETSVSNLQKLAKSLGCTSKREDRGERSYAVIIDKGEGAEAVAPDSPDAFTPDEPNLCEAVVVVNSETMGRGDDTLGKNIMKAFIFSISQQDPLPRSIIFYNGGVHWTTEGTEAYDDLSALADAGVEILSCGNCLKFYGLEDKVVVGDVTNMYMIVEKQLQASVVIQP